MTDVNDSCSSSDECELICWSVEKIGAITDRLFAQVWTRFSLYENIKKKLILVSLDMFRRFGVPVFND